MNLEILPLAITMMAGPQIISAIIFVTANLDSREVVERGSRGGIGLDCWVRGALDG